MAPLSAEAPQRGTSVTPTTGTSAAPSRGGTRHATVFALLALGLALAVGSVLPEQPLEVRLVLDLRVVVLVLVLGPLAWAMWSAGGDAPGGGAAQLCSTSARAGFAGSVKASANQHLERSASGGLDGVAPEARLSEVGQPPEVPEEMLRALVAWRPPALELGGGGLATEAQVQELCLRQQCPVCREVLLAPRKLSCQHHACGRCLERLCDEGETTCPCCNASVDLKAAMPPEPELASSLDVRLGVCTACGGFEGNLEELKFHFLSCPPAQGAVALRLFRLAAEDEKRRLRPEALAEAATAALRTDMLGTSPALVHQIPGHAVDQTRSYWSTPPFTVGGCCFSLRMGPLSGGNANASKEGTRYFCLLPHGHTERLRCSLFFARRPGEGFKERRVHDWPKELAGHPWGPTVRADEVQELRQADGSLLLMLHAVGLGAEGEDEVATGGDMGGGR